MKLITAVVNPETLPRIKKALRDMGIHGMTVGEVRGYGRQEGSVETYRGEEYVVEFVDKLKIEVLTNDIETDKALDALVDAAWTGGIGDGKAWVTTVDKIVRVRTGERDDVAL